MGGLLCMATICSLVNTHQIDTLSRIGGLILMATPQTGSQRVPTFLSWFSKDFHALRPHGDFVMRLNETFVNSLSLDESVTAPGKIVIPTRAVLGASDFWVDKLSASLRLPDKHIKMVRGSHRAIVKPQTKQTDAYQFVRGCIETFLRISEDLRPLPASDSVLWKYSLKLIARNLEKQPWHNGIPIKKVIEEQDEELIDLSRPVLIYGPPNVGKTCWAIRQAWHWMQQQTGYATALLVNASRDKPDLLALLVEELPPNASILFVIDDIHFAREDLRIWVESLDAVRTYHTNRVDTIWISRDPSLQEKLKTSTISQLELRPFPIDRVIMLYTRVLQNYEPWQRVIAAFETGLDPRITREAIPKTPPHVEDFNRYEEFAKWVKHEVHRYLRWRLDETQKVLGEAYKTYLLLLPTGSISYPLEATFLGELGASATRAVEERGLGTFVDGDRIALTEHPFQIWLLLQALQSRHENAYAHTLLEQRFPNYPITVTLSDAVFARYLSRRDSIPELTKRLDKLANYAEWAGTRESVAKALRFLLGREDWTRDGAIRDLANRWYRKLTRTSYPDDESTFMQVLHEDRMQWMAERGVAEQTPDCKSGNNRLDTILYEIGYIDSLAEYYDQAKEFFSLSVEAGLAAIARGIQAQPNTPERTDGANALAHIWIAGMLERSAPLRQLLRKALDGQHTNALQQEMNRLATEIASIHVRLATANRATRENSAELYLSALQAIRPSWRPPATGTLFQRTEQMEDALGRHERNAWAHALETSCWPVLFGLGVKRIPTTVPPFGGDYQPAFPPPAPPVGLPAYRDQGIALLYRWADDPTADDLEEKAILTAALRRAGGGFEYLGETVLLAWRCASSEETANALAWYLECRVPTVGFNGLPKAALRHLTNIGQRILFKKRD